MSMTEFCGQDLTGARFQRMTLQGANEEWEHRLYAERDLTAPEKES